MQSWAQQIGEMNTRIWQEFLDHQKTENSGEDAQNLAELPYFKWIKEYYQTYSTWMEKQIKETEGVSEKVKEDAAFWSKQTLSALSPNNYFWTNPAAINEFVETKGESFRIGLKTGPTISSVTACRKWSIKPSSRSEVTSRTLRGR